MAGSFQTLAAEIDGFNDNVREARYECDTMKHKLSDFDIKLAEAVERERLIKEKLEKFKSDLGLMSVADGSPLGSRSGTKFRSSPSVLTSSFSASKKVVRKVSRMSAMKTKSIR